MSNADHDRARETPTSRRPRRQTGERHLALQDALIGEAARMMEETGLAGFRARTLADRAGCALGAIYTVFPDLDALILAVNGRTLDAIDGAMLGATPGETVGPTESLLCLAEAYLTYVAAHPKRSDALFTHRMAAPRPLPDWYHRQQAAVFAHIEAPLAALRPDLSPDGLSLLARTLFSAVHGVVSLGLDQKLAPIEPAALRDQLRIVVGALASGLKPRDP